MYFHFFIYVKANQTKRKELNSISNKIYLLVTAPYSFYLYSNSTHGRLITMILTAFSLLSIVLFAIFSVLILTGIKIVLKLYSRQHNKTYSSISGILINSCSFFCNTALSGNCSLYSATIIGDRVLLIAYSTTSSSLEAQRIIPTLGFSFSFFF